MIDDFTAIKKIIDVKENIPIAPFVVSKTGGVVDRLVEINRMEELLKILPILFKKNILYSIIGEGSKSIFAEEGQPGLLIVNSTKDFIVIKQNSQVIVDSGIKLNNLVNRLAEHELSGLEVFAQKNGTLAGWLTQDNKVYQVDLCDYVKNITLYLPSKGTVVQYSGKWLSQNKKIFDNKNKRSPVILNAKLQFISAKKDAILMKIKSYSAKNQIETYHIGLIENIFIESFSEQSMNKFKSIWINLKSDNPVDYLEEILTDTDIKKKIIPELLFQFKPNNILLIKKKINPIRIKNCLDTIISAVYDKFDVQLKYSLKFPNLINDHETD